MLDNSKISKGHRAGFTLIEVMVAMVIVTMMIVMIGNIFQQVSDSWNIGTQSSNANTAGRAAMDLIVRELSHAVAGPIEHAEGVLTIFPEPERYLSMDIVGNNEIKFVTLMGNVGPDAAGPKEALMGVAIWHENSLLKYSRGTASFKPYSERPSRAMGSSGNPLIPNVTDFKVYAYATKADFEIGNTTDVFTDQLPYCVDIFLELLSSDDMLRYPSVPVHVQQEFRERNARRFSTRVYFPNRRGYGAN